jgi:nucleotide-binding universal stress UspA family protein
MVPIRSILAGTDLSAPSLHAVDRGYLLAEASDARYTVLHALGLEPVVSLRRLLGESTEALTEQVARDAQRRLHRITADPRRNRGVTADAVVDPGLPDPALSTFVEQHGCDLLILGSRGAGALRRLIFGSTASRVLRRSKIPVLIVKNKAREPYRRVLIAVDFSPTSSALIQISRAVAPDAQLSLLHVCADATEGQMRYAGVAESVISGYRAAAERLATPQLAELASSCGLSPDQYIGHVVHGGPARELDHHEKEHAPDLIVLGKHGTHLTEELLLGSVTKRALDTSRADLLVMTDSRRSWAV